MPQLRRKRQQRSYICQLTLQKRLVIQGVTKIHPCYAIDTKIFLKVMKIENFGMKIYDIFNIFSQNIYRDCRYTLVYMCVTELHCRGDIPTIYVLHKNIPVLLYIKVGLEGVYITLQS